MIIFRDLDEGPWVHRYWWGNQVSGFMRRLFSMPESSSHVDILRDKNAGAQEYPSCGNWAGGIVKRFRQHGKAVPVLSFGMFNWLQLPRFSDRHGWSALQALEWSACVPIGQGWHLPKRPSSAHILQGLCDLLN